MHQPITRVRIRRTRTNPLLTALFAVLSLSVTAIIGAAIMNEAVVRLDASIVEGARNIRSKPLNEIARWFDWIGSTTGYAALTVIAVIAFLVGRKFAACGLTVLSVAGAYALNSLVKTLVERPRPDIGALFAADGHSFPSGNATISVALFGYAAVVLAGMLAGSTWRKLVYSAAILIILLVGAFRIYAGVHYASDIVAGYFLGAAWLFVVLLLHRD